MTSDRARGVAYGVPLPAAYFRRRAKSLVGLLHNLEFARARERAKRRKRATSRPGASQTAGPVWYGILTMQGTYPANLINAALLLPTAATPTCHPCCIRLLTSIGLGSPHGAGNFLKLLCTAWIFAQFEHLGLPLRRTSLRGAGEAISACAL